MTATFDMDWEDAQIDKELENDAVNKSNFEKEVKKLVSKNKHKELETLILVTTAKLTILTAGLVSTFWVSSATGRELKRA